MSPLTGLLAVVNLDSSIPFQSVFQIFKMLSHGPWRSGPDRGWFPRQGSSALKNHWIALTRSKRLRISKISWAEVFWAASKFLTLPYMKSAYSIVDQFLEFSISNILLELSSVLKFQELVFDSKKDWFLREGSTELDRQNWSEIFNFFFGPGPVRSVLDQFWSDFGPWIPVCENWRLVEDW